MSRRSFTACAGAAALALCVSLSLTAPAQARRAATPVSPGFVGMVLDQPVWPDPYVDLPKQLDVMVSSGVESVRAVFDWAEAQPYRRWSDVPAGQRSQFSNVGGIPTTFTALDPLVAAAAQRRITVLPVIQNAPAWDGQKSTVGFVMIPRSPQPYAAFAAALVRRYGSTGTFWSAHPEIPKVPIELWQVWNEPNLPAFWPAQPYRTRYLALLRAAHAAIKAADPRAKVVLAGLANYSWIELARIYKVRGARRLFDVVSAHPFTKTPAGVITILGYMRKEMDLAGDRNKPIVADEVSWPSSLGHSNHNVGYDFSTTEAGQAQRIGQLLPLLVKNRIRLRLAGFDYYNWATLERDNFITWDFAGLFRVSNGRFSAKPGYYVFRRDALAMEGCRAKVGQATNCQR